MFKTNNTPTALSEIELKARILYESTSVLNAYSGAEYE